MNNNQNKSGVNWTHQMTSNLTKNNSKVSLKYYIIISQLLTTYRILIMSYSLIEYTKNYYYRYILFKYTSKDKVS